MKRLCLILVLILLVGGVTLGCSIAEDKVAAENVAASLFEAVRNKDFDTAMTFYSPKFFEVTPRDDWLQALEAINVKLGDLQTYELTDFKINKVAGTAESGTYCELKYEVTYSKYPATESITLYKPPSGGEFKIVGHNINSIGLVKE